MKRLLIVCGVFLAVSCNVDVNEDNDGDSLDNRLDSFVEKADTTLERWGDTAKARYKDIRSDVEDRIDNDRRDSAR